LHKLDDGKNIAIEGEWDKETGGGCHLFDKKFEKASHACTWMYNPKYLLKFKDMLPIKAKVTLSRSERHWRKQIARDVVACMVGIYVLDL